MTISRPLAPTRSTEISTFRVCQRKWAAEYADDSWGRSGEHGHFALGTALHKVCENYIKHGTMPVDAADPITELFMAALPYLPKPFDYRKIEVREDVMLSTPHGPVPARVQADYLGDLPDGVVRIIDYKTSKDPRRYGKNTKEDKLADTQTVLYAYAYDRGHGVVFDHIYIQKHKAAYAKYESRIPPGAPEAPRAYSTAVHLTSDEIREAYERVVAEPAGQLYQIRRKGMRIDPLSLPSPDNEKVCTHLYGGCPYIDRCYAGDPFPPRPVSSRHSPAPADTPAPPRALTLAEWLAGRYTTT